MREGNEFKENIGVIRCPFQGCNARVILLSNTLISQQFTVDNGPEMVILSRDDDSNCFFKLEDMWDFDNIGVTRSSEDLPEPLIQRNDEILDFKVDRLLVCSECDKGPIGFAGYQNGERDVKNLKAFLSCKSVLYDV